jgi:hypothetical protein
MEARAKMLQERIAAHRCYLEVATDINIVRQVLRAIALDEAELSALRPPLDRQGERDSARPRGGDGKGKQGMHLGE